MYTRAQPPAPPRPAGPPIFLVDPINQPDWNHPLFRDFDNVAVGVNIEVRCKYTPEGKQTWAAAAGPADTTYGFMTVLARLMDGHARARVRHPFKWFAVPAGFGAERVPGEMKTYPNAVPLLNHPKDRLRSGRRGPFIAEGARVNRAWAIEFLDQLASSLAFQRLPDPVGFMLISEAGLGDEYGGHHGVPDKGWVPEALTDPRAKDAAHLIDGRRTLAEYWEMSRTLDGGPVPEYKDKVPLGLMPGASPLNDESSERYRGLIRLAWDWSLELAFGSVARAMFRRDPARPYQTVKIGEYTSSCDSPWAPVRVRPQTLLHQMCGIFHSDVQCPDWYGGVRGYRPQETFNLEPGWETEKNWLRIFPNDEKNPPRRLQRLALDVAKDIASSCARSAPHAPLAPYVVNGTEFPTDMVEYLRHCRSLGAWGVNVFMEKPDKAAMDYWAKIVPEVSA